jgi:hypothetical protein
MNLEAEILKEHSKRQTVKIGKWVGNDSKRFRQLMALFLRGDYRVTQRSAWIVSYSSDHYPALIRPWLPSMVKKMQEPGVHDAVLRNVVRILQCVDIPCPILGRVMAQCFDYLASPGYPIAVRANAMTVLCNIAKKEPAIKRELRAMIEQMLPHAGSGLLSRGRKVLKQLDSLGR